MEFSTVRLATLRSAEGLFALRVQRQPQEDGDLYSEELVPLRAGCDQPELFGAWKRLAAVREIEPAVLDAVRVVLSESVLDLDADRPELPALTIEAPPPPYQPTAANPRAYRGTKDRPAKPKRPEVSDLRPFLCSAVGQDRLLSMLTAKLGEVELPQEERSQSSGFRRYFEEIARVPEKRSAVTAAYHQLGLDSKPELRLAVAFMFAATPEHAPAWCKFLAALEPARQRPTLDLLWKTGAELSDPSKVLEHLVAADQLTTDKQFPKRMTYVLERFYWNGSEVERCLPCFELVDTYDPGIGFSSSVPAPTLEDTATLQAFLERFKPNRDWYVANLLTCCAHSLHFASILLALMETELSAQHAHEFAGALSGADDDSDQEKGWLDVRNHFESLLTVLVELPASHRTQACDLIEEFVEPDAPGHFGPARQLLRLVCVPPFAVESNLEVPLVELAELKPIEFAAILQAPIESFLLLEKRSMRENDARLISSGFYGFIQEAPGFLVECFKDAPGPLCRAARALGVLSWPIRRELIRRALKSLLVNDKQDHEALDAASLIALVDEHAGENGATHVPRQLRLHLQGELELRPGQVQRHLERLQAAWPAVCCAAIRRSALERLSHGLIDVEQTDLDKLSDQMSHALMLQARTYDHRRSLRRLIRACYKGNTEFLLQHPRNQAWVNAHSTLPITKWLTGIEFEREIEPNGRVHLTIESDPLEALRLGTYVGSCLGLGGKLMWSAAATVLDINKQVVFARTAKGGFLARQIMGITEKGFLACFDVYPQVSPDLRRAFRDYNLGLAKELGLEIFVEPEESTDKGDKVTSTLSQDWWDDYVWDHSIDA